VLATATVKTSDSGPEPDLPACFHDYKYAEKLVRSIGGQNTIQRARSAI
jgi:hypothetical protein